MKRLPNHITHRLWLVLRDEWRVRFTAYATWFAFLSWTHAWFRRKEVQRQSGKSLQIGTFWRGCKTVGAALLGGDRSVRGRL